ncbi:MAG: hypothetical protein E6R04_07195 [Spirochaetes bacterium]|nr:MAG: hypothetical protein E6R04_07195 [Spirochaetota bacterium]
MAEPGEQPGGTAGATVAIEVAVTTGTTVAAEQTTLTTGTTVGGGAGSVGVPARAAGAVDPPARRAVGVQGGTVRAVAERAKPVDVGPVERGIRGARQIQCGSPDTGQVEIGQDRIPGRLATESVEEGRPTGRVQHHRPGSLVTPVGAQIGNGVAQVGTQ